MSIKASIVIRTKNEERWISHTLQAVFSQKYESFEVILVDNESTDHTVDIAKRFPLKAIVNIEDFTPGKALNAGALESSGDFLVFLSAHCVPKDDNWLSNLLKPFSTIEGLAGVYGRQLPVSFSSPIDKRDLLLVFGADSRTQIKDYFFHNANSAIPRKLWEKYPFDESVKNVEDRVWGRTVITKGYVIYYEAEAEVFHHHGLHQGNDSKRASGVVSVIEKVESGRLQLLPNSLHPSGASIFGFIAVTEGFDKDSDLEPLKSVLKSFKESVYTKKIALLAPRRVIDMVSREFELITIERPSSLNADLDLGKVMKFGLQKIEELNFFPEALLYANFRFTERPINIFDRLIEESQFDGFDSTFASYVDYGNYWKQDDFGNLELISDEPVSRKYKKPMYKALYGCGCLTSSQFLRQGVFLGDRIGVVTIDE